MPLRYLWVFVAYIALRKAADKFHPEYRFVKNQGIALTAGIWCFVVTAFCCIFGMYVEGDPASTALNVITPFVLTALGLILPIIKKNEKAAGFVKTAFLLPYSITSVIASCLWMFLYMDRSGFINVFLKAFGLKGEKFLGSTSQAMVCIAVVLIWINLGYNIILFLSAIKDIPYSYYEAAKLDGANSWQTFWKITLPLMVSTVSTNVLLCIIGGLKVFDIIIAMTNGGPGMSTQVLNTTIYSYFGSGALSTGCAANVLLTILVVICFVIIKKGFGKWEEKTV